jgi:hypothetical protein
MLPPSSWLTELELESCADASTFSDFILLKSAACLRTSISTLIL